MIEAAEELVQKLDTCSVGSWEREFINSLKKNIERYTTLRLSQKQETILLRMEKQYLASAPPVPSGGKTTVKTQPSPKSDGKPDAPQASVASAQDIQKMLASLDPDDIPF